MAINIAELTQDGLGEFDLQHLTEIIRENMGSWYHADLMRALHILLPHADSHNMARLEAAYPGSVAAYKLWCNDPMGLAHAAGKDS